MVACKKRQSLRVKLHVLRVGRHDHLHEVLGDAVAAFALHENLVDITVIKIADRPLDEIALFINLRGRYGFQRQFADLFPQTLKVFVITLDLRLGAFGSCSTHDQSGALRNFDLVGNLLELLAVGRIGDLAADTAAPCSVGHKHAVTPGKTEIGSQRCTLVATLFLDDLHQQDLADLDDFLNLVALRTGLAGRANVFLVIVIRHGFDAVVLGRGIGSARSIGIILVL